MREILFRGKRIDNGEWVYGYYCASIGCKNGIEQVGYFIHTSDNNFAVDPDTVGQYTGLTDKYGKGIYEGDVCIVSLSYFKIKNEKATVAFINGAFQFQYGCEQFFSKPHGAWDEVEVIGNIHDNPELLTEAEERR